MLGRFVNAHVDREKDKWPGLFAVVGRLRGTGSSRRSIYDTGASDGFHSYLPIPVLALQDSKPVTLDVIAFDGD
jgi:hypothetical protein